VSGRYRVPSTRRELVETVGEVRLDRRQAGQEPLDGSLREHRRREVLVRQHRVDGVVVRLLVTGSNGMRGYDALVAAGIEPISEWAARWALAAPAVLAVG